MLGFLLNTSGTLELKPNVAMLYSHALHHTTLRRQRPDCTPSRNHRARGPFDTLRCDPEAHGAQCRGRATGADAHAPTAIAPRHESESPTASASEAMRGRRPSTAAAAATAAAVAAVATTAVVAATATRRQRPCLSWHQTRRSSLSAMTMDGRVTKAARYRC